MTTECKATANRANAARATGPRTAGGKAVAKANALTHGLRSSAAVLPGESAAEWEAFRAGVGAGLAPAGAAEAESAARVASLQ